MTGKLIPFLQTDIEQFNAFALSLTDKTLTKAISENWFTDEQSPATAKSLLNDNSNDNSISAETFNSELANFLTTIGLKKIKRAFSKYRSNKANQTVKINEQNMISLNKIQQEFSLESTNDTIEYLLEPTGSMQNFIDDMHDLNVCSEQHLLEKLENESKYWSTAQKEIWLKILTMTIEKTVEGSIKYRKITGEKVKGIVDGNPFIACLK